MKKISELKEDWLKCQINILKSNGVSKADIARDLEVLPQYINSITSGSRGISDAFLDKFIFFYKINQFDLFQNSDILSPKENIQSVSDEITKHLVNKIESQAKELGKLEGKIEYLEDELKKRRENDAKPAYTQSVANVG